MRARIQYAKIAQSKQTIRVAVGCMDSPLAGRKFVDVYITLGEESMNNPAQERMVSGVVIAEGSRAERVLSAAYDGMLGERDAPQELAPVPAGTPQLGTSRTIDYDEPQSRFIHYSASSRHALVYLDAGAGTGKTTALVAGCELCAQQGAGVIILAAATNTAVGVATTKLEEIATTFTTIMRFVSKPGAMATKSDLQEWLLKLDYQSGSSQGFKDRVALMRRSMAELAKLKAACPDPDEMSTKASTRCTELEQHIKRLLRRCTRDALYLVKPKVVAITLDYLLCRLAGREDPLAQYVRSAGSVVLFADECSQAPEGVMCALAAALPHAYHRYIGDSAQLDPHCLINSSAHDFDRAFGACGIADVLARATGCPRVTMRTGRRQHPGIVALPSLLFYDGTLLSAVTAEERAAPFPMPDPSHPIVLMDVHGTERTVDSGSRFNDDETAAAGRLARKVKRFTDSVLVLAFYKAHVDRFKESFPDVEVRLIDVVEGRKIIKKFK